MKKAAPKGRKPSQKAMPKRGKPAPKAVLNMQVTTPVKSASKEEKKGTPKRSPQEKTTRERVSAKAGASQKTSTKKSASQSTQERKKASQEKSSRKSASQQTQEKKSASQEKPLEKDVSQQTPAERSAPEETPSSQPIVKKCNAKQSSQRKRAQMETDSFAIEDTAPTQMIETTPEEEGEVVTLVEDTDADQVRNLHSLLKTSAKVAPVIQELVGRAPSQGRKRGRSASTEAAEDLLTSKSTTRRLVTELVNMLCRACGSALDMQPWQMDENVETTLEEVFARIDAESPDAYIVGGNDTAHRLFRRNFDGMWSALVSALSPADVTALAEALLPWLLAMSESKSRAFRHTACIAAFAFATGILQQTTASRKTLSPTEIELLTAIVSDIYAKIFIRRARDVHQPIRALAIDTLTEWVRLSPAEYSGPEYTKNLGFLLHDKSPEIRRHALENLQILYSEDNAALDGVRRFTDRFRERILEQARDSDPACVEAALRLSTQMMRYDFSTNQLQSIDACYPKETIHMALRTIFDEKPAVRHAAGGLFDLVLKLNTTGYAPEERTAKRLEMLLRFVKESRETRLIPNAAWYVVDAMYLSENLHKDTKKRRKAANSLKSPSILEEHFDEIFAFSTSSTNDLSLVRSAVEVCSALCEKITPHISKDYETDEPMLAAFSSDRIVAHVLSALELHGSLPDIAPIIIGMLEHVQPAQIRIENDAFPKLFAVLRAKFSDSDDYAILNPIAAFFEKIVPFAAATSLTVRETFTELQHATKAAALESTSVAPWRRAHALYRVADLGEIRGSALEILQNFISADESEKSAAEVSRILPVVGCVYRSCFWAFQRIRKSAESPEMSENLSQELESTREVLSKLLLQVSQASPDFAVDLFCVVSDIATIDALPVSRENCAFTPRLFCDLAEGLLARYQQITAKRAIDCKKSAGDSRSVERVSIVHATANAALRAIAGQLTRLTASVSRLVRFGALSVDGIASVLPMWPRMPEKHLSDSLKEVFRVVKAEMSQNRDSQLFPEITAATDRFALAVSFECGIIRAALSTVHAKDSQPAAVQDFQNLCTRLAQTHFMPQTDANYREIVQITKRLLESVKQEPTENAALLCAVAPYASRLKAEHAKEITRDFVENRLRDIPEYYRALFVKAIRRRVPLGSQETNEIENTNESIDLDLTARESAETLLATPRPSASQIEKDPLSFRELSVGDDLFGRNRASSFRDLSLAQDAAFFEAGSMETLLATNATPPHSQPSKELVDTVARPSGNSERSSLAIADESSEYLVESQILYE